MRFTTEHSYNTLFHSTVTIFESSYALLLLVLDEGGGNSGLELDNLVGYLSPPSAFVRCWLRLRWLVTGAVRAGAES